MSIGFLSLGFAAVCGIVCIVCMAYDTIPHEQQREQRPTIDYSKLNPIEL